MPPKRRCGKDLPPNLYVSLKAGVSYYAYKDTRPGGRLRGMGTDKAAAVADAIELNAAIALQMQQTRVSKVVETKPETPLLSSVILKHIKLQDQRHERGKLALNTIRKKREYCESIRKALGGIPIGEIGVRDVVGFLEGYGDKERTAKAARGEFMEIYKTAMQLGFVAVNVPALTRPIETEVRRSRLSLDQWQAVRKSADGLDHWIGLSMDLALVSAQRRDDISSLEFRPREGASAWVEYGALWVIQGKTGSKVCIPLALRMDAVGLVLGEVIQRCRDTILSPYLLHYRSNINAVKRGDCVGAQNLSKGFAKARSLSGITWEAGKTAPTFHEQRSTSAREYIAQGGVDVQALLGHRQAATTDIYRDSRGSSWAMVKAV